MTAAHAHEYELPDDPRWNELVESTAAGNVIYLTRFGRHVAAVTSPTTGVDVRASIMRSDEYTDQEKAALIGLLDALDAARQRAAAAAATDQAWFWTPEWQAGEREVDNDPEPGRLFGSDEEFLAALEAGIGDPSALR